MCSPDQPSRLMEAGSTRLPREGISPSQLQQLAHRITGLVWIIRPIGKDSYRTPKKASGTSRGLLHLRSESVTSGLKAGSAERRPKRRIPAHQLLVRLQGPERSGLRPPPFWHRPLYL